MMRAAKIQSWGLPGSRNFEGIISGTIRPSPSVAIPLASWPSEHTGIVTVSALCPSYFSRGSSRGHAEEAPEHRGRHKQHLVPCNA